MPSAAKLICIGLVGALATTNPQPARAASTANYGIALSNSYAGNSWRQQMLTMWNLGAKQAISSHDIAKTKVVNANNSAP